MADDLNDPNYKIPSRRVDVVWTSSYASKFSKLLLDNSVVLQNRGLVKDDPMHQLKKHALEHLRVQLGMKSIDQVKNKINSFKKFSVAKMDQCLARSGPKASHEAIMRSAPRWLRNVEPHFNLLKRAGSSRKKKCNGTVTTDKATKATRPLMGRGTHLALALAQAARAARTLEARAVLRQIKKLPQRKKDEVQYIWWRMLDVVRQKLTILRDSGVSAEHIQGARFTPVESMLADLVLLFDDSICTVSESGDYDSTQALVELFHLAQLHGLEDVEAGPDRWRRAHRAYKARSINLSGICSSLVLMQRRWHELKKATRLAFVAYCRPTACGDPKPPSPLYAAIAKRFPQVLTTSLVSWREHVNRGNVVEDDDDQSAHITDEIPAQAVDIEGMNLLSAKELAHYERSAKDDEDDLTVIEKDIETIDLINIDDNEDNLNKKMQYAFDDRAQEQLRNKRKYFAEQLAVELDKQLKEIQMEAVSDLDMLRTEPCGTPLVIYDSDESDIECTEDRQRNIELIASQMNDEATSDNDVTVIDHIATKIKEEIISEVYCVSDATVDDEGNTGDEENSGDKGNSGVEWNSGDKGNSGVEGDEDCMVIDSKLFMDTRVNLVKVNETPEWRTHAQGQITIDVNNLNMSLFQSPKAELPVGLDEIDMNVTVKIEKVELESEPETPTGERQVKSMAKRLISEIMRDETDSSEISSRSRACVRKVRRLMDSADEGNNRVTKKVQLPNIDEVRKNNMSMLTAQVAPLSTDESADTGDKQTDGRRLSSDSDTLQIDESIDMSRGNNAIFSQSELDKVLQKLAKQRDGSSHGRGGEWPSPATHCCTARRQRAFNAARARIAARAGRLPPPVIDLHGASLCVRMKKCVCCCAHLLQAGEASVKLYQEAKDIDSALNKLWDDGCIEISGSQEPESVDNEISNDSSGKPSTSRKPRKKLEPESTPQPAVDPLEEWNRQKNLNQQYFNLNLKPQQAKKPNLRKFHLIPKDNPNAPPRVVYAQAKSKIDKNNFKVQENGKLADFPITVAQQAVTANTDQQPNCSNGSMTSDVSGQLLTNNIQLGNIHSNVQPNAQPDNTSCFTVSSVISGQLQTRNVKPGNTSIDCVTSRQSPDLYVQSVNIPSNVQPDNSSCFSVSSVISGQLQTQNVQPGNTSIDCVTSRQSPASYVQPVNIPSNVQPDVQPDDTSCLSVSSVISGRLQTQNNQQRKTSNDCVTSRQSRDLYVQSVNIPSNVQPDNSSCFSVSSVISGQLQTQNVQPSNTSIDCVTSRQSPALCVQPVNIPSNVQPDVQPDNTSSFSVSSVISGQLQTQNVQPGNTSIDCVTSRQSPALCVQPVNIPSNVQPDVQPDNTSSFSVSSVISGQLQTQIVQPGNTSIDCVTSRQSPALYVQPVNIPSNVQPNNSSCFSVSSIISGQLQTQNVQPGNTSIDCVTSRQSPALYVQPVNIPNNVQPDNTSCFSVSSVISGRLQTQNNQPRKTSNDCAASGQSPAKVGNIPSIVQPHNHSNRLVTSVNSEQRIKIHQTGKTISAPKMSLLKNAAMQASDKIVAETNNKTKIVKLNQDSAPSPSQSVAPLYFKVKTVMNKNKDLQVVPAKDKSLTKKKSQREGQNDSCKANDTNTTLRSSEIKAKVSAGVKNQTILNTAYPGVAKSKPPGYYTIRRSSAKPPGIIVKRQLLNLALKRIPGNTSVQNLPKLAPKPASNVAIDRPLLNAVAISDNIVGKDTSPGSSTLPIYISHVRSLAEAPRPAEGSMEVTNDQVNQGTRNLVINSPSSKALSPNSLQWEVSQIRRKNHLTMADDIQMYYKHRKATITVDNFLFEKDLSNLMMLCMDQDRPLLVLANEYFILTEHDLKFPHPEYWSIGNLPNSSRILLETSKDNPKPSPSTDGKVLVSSNKICLDRKTYIKLKETPLVYSKVLFALRSPQEAHNLLMQNSCLQVISARTGTLLPLTKNYTQGENTLAVSCPVIDVAKALVLLLNELPATPTSTFDIEGMPAKANINARAHVAMSLNNVNRKPIEMVYIDSDEEDIKTNDFKGLANFENLDEFDL